MPSDYWARPPTREEALKFLDEVRQTKRPEDHLWVSDDWVDPEDPQLQHQIVVRVEFDAQSRNEELIPCALCQRPKFYIGRLLWSSDDKLRLVGRDCAARHFAAWSEYEETYNREVRTTAFKDSLKHALPLITPCIQHIETFRDYCRPIVSEQRKLREQLPQMYNMLRIAARQHGGRLVIEERVASEDIRELMGADALRGQSQTTFATIGILRGSAFLTEDQNAMTECGQISKDLNDLHHFKDGALTQAKIDAAVNRMSSRNIDRAAKLCQSVARRTIDLHTRVLEMRGFLSPRNFREIKAWGEHPLNRENFEVELTRTTATVLWGANAVSFRLNISLPPEPDLFRRIQDETLQHL